MAIEIGTRVIAVMDADEKQVRVYGRGVYEGDFVPDEGAAGIAAWLREARRTNPRIRLDSGEVVYGAECWWGPEAAADKVIGTRTVVDVSITEARQRVKAAEDQALADFEAMCEEPST